ncbi:heterokaryon incompatibility protein-domain-containing protein [Podospora australis]|uniref:Heterokaryon incompatibility protein-domain-containing protein n=1 Tax=Podospora australis TaxID=1536484 RepID=A0AAN6WKW9_9PEZI|nr:heterokaryon incompatibility protein-domain-containing protein [Podospora australis]
MTTEDPLCQYCVQIELDPNILESHGYRQVTWTLGPGSRVKQSQCPFCKLVVRASFRSELSDTEEVKVKWFAGGGTRPRVFSLLSHFAHATITFSAATPNPDIYGHSVCYLRQVRNPTIDLTFVNNCLAVCSSQHGTQCNVPFDKTTAFPGLPHLRLIDVQRDCIVKVNAPIHVQYVALSYVWGGKPVYKTTTANVASLPQDGALGNGKLSLPSTIRDAIALVLGLGLQYLWIDALCLVQDDMKDLAAGIAVMDEVYERSWFTIVAACGKDADAGLSGVQPGSRDETQLCAEVKPGIHLGIDLPLEAALQQTVYSTRGWTYQEQLLSRRSLFFVDDRAVFRCRQAEHSEDHADTFGTGELKNSDLSLLTETVNMPDPTMDFSFMLLYYTRRNFTNESDVLKAMDGLMRRFSERMKCPFFEGLPTACFDVFVLFTSLGSLFRRRKEFPSYSWTGWRGEIHHENDVIGTSAREMNEWLACKTCIIWYHRMPGATPQLVWDFGTDRSFPIHDPAYVGYRGHRQPFKPPPSVQVDASRTQPSTDVPVTNTSLPEYPLLQFWTLAVYFYVDALSRKEHTPAWRAITTGPGHSSPCGSLMIDGYEDSKPFFESKGVLELILLSEDPAGTKYYVMLLEWKDGVAERRGMGSIEKDSVSRSLSPGPVWKEILLA